MSVLEKEKGETPHAKERMSAVERKEEERKEKTPHAKERMSVVE
jgi:hypothetical protein